MFYWDEKSINWFTKSANQTEFHKKLATEINQLIDRDNTLLSLGSGLGFLERELSPSFKKMILVDNNNLVVEYLNENKTENQEIINSDWDDIKYESDYLLLSFFSRMYVNDDLDKYLKLARKKIFYIVNERHTDMNVLIKYLLDKKAKFSLKSLRLNFNQILNTNEIDDYINHYYSSFNEEKKYKLLKQFERIDQEKVIFKNKKKVILFVIERGEY